MNLNRESFPTSFSLLGGVGSHYPREDLHGGGSAFSIMSPSGNPPAAIS
jgi:hypothetical protein